MPTPNTTDQLLNYIRSHYQPGEPLRAKRTNAELSYQGIGTYPGHWLYKHRSNQPVVMIHSEGARTRPEIRLFPEILLTLLQAYPNEPDQKIIESLDGKLKDFLKRKNVPTDFPNLFTDESYYSAMIRSLYEKLSS
jgi:hypothetical protein